MYKLRELERRDLVEINKWRNDPELISSLGAPFRYINLNVDEAWFDEYMKNRGNTIRCAIIEENKNEILGLVTLTKIDYVNQSAEFHIMIGNKDNHGKGMGTYAIKKIVNHAFYNLNLHRIELTVLEDNLKAQHLYEKVGFVKEGVKRSAVYKNGTFKNMFVYAVLRSEWQHTVVQ